MKRIMGAIAAVLTAAAICSTAHAETFTFDLTGTGYLDIAGFPVSTAPDQNITGTIYGLAATGVSSATAITVEDPGLQGLLNFGSGGDFTVYNNKITSAEFEGLVISSEISGAQLTLAGNTGSYDAAVLFFEYGIDNGAVTYASAVPEPATWAMMMMGLGAIGIAFRTSKRRSGAATRVPATA